MKNNLALSGVSNKAGIVEFAQELKKLWFKDNQQVGLKCPWCCLGWYCHRRVTGFPEVMDGRVKTLHPNIHSGLLARRDLDSRLGGTLGLNGSWSIDLVVKTFTHSGILGRVPRWKNISIGGPSMLHVGQTTRVTVVADPADYAVVLDGGSQREQVIANVWRRKSSAHSSPWCFDRRILHFAQSGVKKNFHKLASLSNPMLWENPQQDTELQNGLLTSLAKQWLNGKSCPSTISVTR